MGFPIAARFAHPDAGYKGTQEHAAAHLEPGRVYIVRRLEVGRSDSWLQLDGPGLEHEQFSTCLFEPADAPTDWDDDPVSIISPDELTAALGEHLAVPGSPAERVAGELKTIIARNRAARNDATPDGKQTGQVT